jgi:hypothetical protein
LELAVAASPLEPHAPLELAVAAFALEAQQPSLEPAVEAVAASAFVPQAPFELAVAALAFEAQLPFEPAVAASILDAQLPLEFAVAASVFAAQLPLEPAVAASIDAPQLPLELATAAVAVAPDMQQPLLPLARAAFVSDFSQLAIAAVATGSEAGSTLETWIIPLSQSISAFATQIAPAGVDAGITMPGAMTAFIVLPVRSPNARPSALEALITSKEEQVAPDAAHWLPAGAADATDMRPITVADFVVHASATLVETRAAAPASAKIRVSFVIVGNS